MIDKANSERQDRTPSVPQLARVVLVAFLLTFATARILVYLIMSRTIPDLYVRVQGTHVHHLNFGIFLLAGLGGYLLFGLPSVRGKQIVAVVYGVGMALTFDEFGMWLHLGGGYWQRASWDAIIVIGALLALAAFASTIGRIRPHDWVTAILLACVLVAFFGLLYRSVAHARRAIGPKIQQIESTAPQ